MKSLRLVALALVILLAGSASPTSWTSGLGFGVLFACSQLGAAGG